MDSLEPQPQAPNVLAAACPSRKILKHVTSRWGVLILIGLRGEKVMRFSALRRKIGGVSERMLAQTLQTLEADGFVRRHAFEVVPPHVEYRLSPLGEEVALRVEEIARFIETNLGTILEERPPKAAAADAEE